MSQNRMGALRYLHGVIDLIWTKAVVRLHPVAHIQPEMLRLIRCVLPGVFPTCRAEHILRMMRQAKAFELTDGQTHLTHQITYC